MAKQNKMQKKTLWLVETAMLSAILIIMAFTPLGYLKTAGLEITFNMIPVVIGAAVAGPACGAVLGLVFGVTSFIQCFGMSAFGATLLGINPFLTFLVCVPTRVLAGFLAGIIAKSISKGRPERMISSSIVASICGPLLNTFFFMTTLVLCFGRTDYIQGIMTSLGAENFLKFIVAFVGVNGLVETGVCFVVGSAISAPLSRSLAKRR